MICPICGFTEPGDAKSCPACGRELVYKPGAGAGAARIAPPRPSIVRFAVYTLIIVGVFAFFGRLYARYMDAQQAEAEAGLLKQVVDQRKQMAEAMEQ